MRRRGNKSSKVPNVKLRPADPAASNPTPSETWWAQDTQADADPDASCVDLCPRPFKGLVVCATGVVDKPALFKQAIELGATSMTAFTDRVTHLIAIDHGGAKYTCALERKIPIMQPSWITESYQIWLKGDDVDIPQSIKQHRLPIFSNVVLSLSGISDIARRTHINKLVTQQQGVYVKNLERPVKVTHLLCSGDEETDKMRYAEKFNKRGEANIHVVWEEWFWDSLEFGGRFAEERYRVVHPRPERKSLPDTPTSPPPSSSALPSEPSSPPKPKPKPKPSSLPTGNHDDAEDEPELASIKRIPAHTLTLWQSLLKPRGFEITAGKLVRSPSKHPPPEAAGPSHALPAPSPRAGGGSILSSFRRANSFVEPVRKNSALLGPRPFRRTQTLMGMPPPETTMDGWASTGVVGPVGCGNEGGGDGSSGAGGLFSGVRFRVLGEARSPNVRDAIDGCGGRIVSDEEGGGEGVDYIIVRLVSGSKFYRDETDETARTKYRTECWLERCIFAERICPPEEHVAFTPLNINTPIQGAEQVNLSFSGLDHSEACWTRRLLRALGIGLAPNFSRRSTHLLCPAGTGAKFDKAREWGVPVVGMGWLEEMAAAAAVVPGVDGHLVLGVQGGAGDGGMCGGLVMAERVEEAPKEDVVMRGVDKGKGKGKEQGHPAHSPEPAFRAPALAFDAPQEMADAQRTAPPTPSPRRENSAHGSFGRPAGVLAEGRRSDSHTSLPPPRGRSPSLEYVTDPSGSCTRSTSHASAGTLSRRATLGEITRDRRVTRVPSSKSPSPLKLPPQASGGSGNGNGGRVASTSPAKVSNEVTKALQESITSLLGKRLPSDEGVGARAGKKVRPHPKGKPRSRPESNEGTHGSPLQAAALRPPAQYPRSLSPFEAHDELHGLRAEESMRVMYEDPGQRDEKRRLMSLFESGDGLGSAKKGGLVRRSTRIAGF